MRKFIFFPLWRIEELEQELEKMEMNGYRLTDVKYSYWFTFKESRSKEMCYFLSYKSFRGSSLGSVEYSLESKHKALLIDAEFCYFSLYRANETKENMSFLYDMRMDYIKSILLEKALTALFISFIFILILFAEIRTLNRIQYIPILVFFIGISVFLMVYYFYGYSKQKSKCKKYKRGKNRNK